MSGSNVIFITGSFQASSAANNHSWISRGPVIHTINTGVFVPPSQHLEQRVSNLEKELHMLKAFILMAISESHER